MRSWPSRLSHWGVTSASAAVAMVSRTDRRIFDSGARMDRWRSGDSGETPAPRQFHRRHRRAARRPHRRFDDVLTDPRSPAAGSAIAGIDVRAGIVAPLVKAGRLIAVFYVLQTAPRRWTDGEIALVSEVAERTWGAVDTARAEVNLRQSEAALRQLTADLEQRVVKRTRQREEAWQRCTSCRRWKRLASSPVASRMISTIFSCRLPVCSSRCDADQVMTRPSIALFPARCSQPNGRAR